LAIFVFDLFSFLALGTETKDFKGVGKIRVTRLGDLGIQTFEETMTQHFNPSTPLADEVMVVRIGMF
jgi:hypothetical protein